MGSLDVCAFETDILVVKTTSVFSDLQHIYNEESSATQKQETTDERAVRTVTDLLRTWPK